MAFFGIFTKLVRSRSIKFNSRLLKKIYFKAKLGFHSDKVIYCKNEGKLTTSLAPTDFREGSLKEKLILKESFDYELETRRSQAQRSVIVQVQSEQSCGQLQEFCTQFGNISNMYHYTTCSSTMHFFLLEFSDKDVIMDIMNACGHNDRNLVIPSHSRMLWFRANKKKNEKNCILPEISVFSSAPALERSQLLEWLENADNVNDQIMLLYQATKLDELQVRLRYMTAHQLEAALSGLFPRAQALLFGSSVNGFGRQGCDLDIVLQLDHRTQEEDTKCRLMFHAKPSINGRSQTQRHIDGLADLIQWFLPGCTDVRRILLAKVPIVKYRQELTDMECDLSLTNMTAVYMSELLYTYGAIDWRLRPLVFTIKRWAAEVGLTNPSPGRWITNFSLTLLVIFYLQQSQILPSLDALRQKAGKTDRRISEDGVNCSFIRDVSKLDSCLDSTSSLETLLLGFFDYYAAFDFATNGIALGTGMPIKKRDHSALYITNPLEPHLNVSQNVSFDETERLKIEFRNAAWELESSCEENNSSSWGLLRLFKENKSIDKARQFEHLYFKSKKKTSDRLVPVSKLFEDEPQQNKSKS